jgi:hypothetical protein
MDYKKLTVDDLKYVIENIDSIKEEVKNRELAQNPECYVIQGVGYMSIIKVNRFIEEHAECEVVEFDTVDQELYYFKEATYHVSRFKTATPLDHNKFNIVMNIAKVALKNIEQEKKGVWTALKSII